jgi:hypothetical protein
MNKAVLITGISEFETKYGRYLSGLYLSHAVHEFFLNGGGSCYVVRVAGPGAEAAAIGIKDRRGAPAKTLTIAAANEGDWGNVLDVVIADGTEDSANEFSITVLRDRSTQNPPLDPVVLETHDNLSMNKASPNYVETAVKARSKYITATVESGNLANADFGTSRSAKLAVGDGTAALKLVGVGVVITVGAGSNPGTLRSAPGPSTNPAADARQILINLNGDAAILPKAVTIPPDAATGDAIALAIRNAVRAMSANTAGNQPAYDNFNCIFDPSGATSYLLTSGTTGAGSSVAVTAPAALPSLLPGAGPYKFVVFVNGDGPHEVVFNGPLATPTDVKNAINAVTPNLNPKRAANSTAVKGLTADYDNTAKAGNPSLVLKSGVAGVDSSVVITDSPTSENVAGTLKLGQSHLGKEITGAAVLRPAKSLNPTEMHLGDALVQNNVASVMFGSNGGSVTDVTFIDGLRAFDVITEVSILAVPGIYHQAVVDAGSSYCAQRMDCFFVADPDPQVDSVEEAIDFAKVLFKTSYSALYYPWLKSVDPTGQSPDPIIVPPSGFVTGMFARIDTKRGVWKAPAGTEANVGGAVGLITDTTDAQQDFLNPIGVNVIRSFPASGIVIWGARTLATRSDPEYRYVPVRRTAIFLEQSIYRGIQWAVFEPNDEPLWASLRLNINAFMSLQFRAGAFQGKTPIDAYFVQCDSKTTTQADIDAGVVNIRVGFAPLKPAEFVVLMLSQKVNQPAA